jgi:hypothetical protein
MSRTLRDIAIGAIVCAVLFVAILLAAGSIATAHKKEACDKFSEAIGEETKFIQYGWGESKCFTTINGTWVDISPPKTSSLSRMKP